MGFKTDDEQARGTQHYTVISGLRGAPRVSRRHVKPSRARLPRAPCRIEPSCNLLHQILHTAALPPSLFIIKLNPFIFVPAVPFCSMGGSGRESGGQINRISRVLTLWLPGCLNGRVGVTEKLRYADTDPEFCHPHGMFYARVHGNLRVGCLEEGVGVVGVWVTSCRYRCTRLDIWGRKVAGLMAVFLSKTGFG